MQYKTSDIDIKNEEVLKKSTMAALFSFGKFFCKRRVPCWRIRSHHTLGFMQYPVSLLFSGFLHFLSFVLYCNCKVTAPFFFWTWFCKIWEKYQINSNTDLDMQRKLPYTAIAVDLPNSGKNMHTSFQYHCLRSKGGGQWLPDQRALVPWSFLWTPS